MLEPIVAGAIPIYFIGVVVCMITGEEEPFLTPLKFIIFLIGVGMIFEILGLIFS